jgi:hypothetical protein
MVIANNFDPSKLDLSFAPVQAEAQATLENAGLSDCNLFHVPFSMSEPCHVIMPRAKRQKPVRGTPRELMSRFKSLSETCSFDTYFRFDTFAQLELRKIFASIAQCHSPTLMLESMYDGRGGGVNLWLNQGLGLEEQDVSEVESKGYRKVHVEEQHHVPPPPYTNDTISSLDLDPHVEVPFSDISVCSVSFSREVDVDPVLETPDWVRMRRILDYRSPSCESPIQRGALKRPASLGSLPYDRANRAKQMCLYRSPAFEPPLSDPVPNSAPVDVTAVHVTTAAAIPPSSPNVEFAEYKRDHIAQWLLSAWTVLPSTHHDLRDVLLALGSTTDVAAFANARINCSTRLAFAAAALTKHTHSTPDQHMALFNTTTDAEEEVRSVICWINGVRPDGDTLLMREIVALARAAMDVVESLASSSDMMEAFAACKARCIASACVLGD